MSPYPLATVLVLREREVEAARTSLGRALDAVDGCRADLRRHDAAIAEHAARAEEAARGVGASLGHRPGDVTACARWARRLRSELSVLAAARTGAERAVAVTERTAADRREALAVARVELRALELHREGWRAARARERDRREQDAADDLVSARPRAAR